MYCVLYVFLFLQIIHERVSVCLSVRGWPNGIQGGEADCPALAGRAAGPALAGRAAGPPAPLSAAVQPAVQFAAVQQINKLDIAQRHEQTLWPSLLGVRSALLVSRVGAHSVALVLYYFNTDQCTMYCVLYVFLFIYYNTVFFIMVRAAQASPEQPDSQIVGQGQGLSLIHI